MRKFVCQFLVLGLIIIPGALQAQDPNTPDTLWVDSATAFVSGVGVVPVRFFNDEVLSLVETTLKHSSEHIKIDSFSFAGGRLDHEDYNKSVLINADSSVITIFSITLSATTIPPGRGLLGHLYYSYSQTITPQVAVIDTTTRFEGPIRYSTQFSPIGGSTFVPQFVPGYLDIQASPATFDSVWVEDAQAAPGDPVTVEVYAYNERNLAKIALALNYSSEELLLDSVSFVATRGAAAGAKTVQRFPSQHRLYVVTEFGNITPLAPGSGPVARLHFRVAPLTPEGAILIDSTTVGIISDTRFYLTDDDGYETFEPRFSAGGVTVKFTTDVEDITDEANLPTEYALSQNYPNPFNPSTNIEFSLPQAGHVKLEIYNILGRRVRRLIDRDLPAGEHRLVFDSRSDQGGTLATGVYFYRLSTESFQKTKKMLLMK